MAFIHLELILHFCCHGLHLEATVSVPVINSASDAGQNGDLIISLIDGPFDFAAYTVDVVATVLTMANGTEVSALPLQRFGHIPGLIRLPAAENKSGGSSL